LRLLIFVGAIKPLNDARKNGNEKSRKEAGERGFKLRSATSSIKAQEENRRVHQGQKREKKEDPGFWEMGGYFVPISCPREKTTTLSSFTY